MKKMLLYLVSLHFLLLLGDAPWACEAVAQSKQEEVRRELRGKVTDSRGEPLVGVRVGIKGSPRGAVTNLDGIFAVTLEPKEHIVTFSYVGYRMLEVDVTNKTSLNVVLEEDNQLLDELVVTGYQTISKERATGAFVLVKPEEIKGKLQTNILDRLEGQVPGLQRNGTAFAIRGTSTLYGEAQPLIVLDGIPYEGSIETINPATVTKVTVLKDAAAASIYGARAANGVIVINTLEGSEDGKVHIAYNATVALRGKPRWQSLDLLSSAELVDLQESTFSMLPLKWEYMDKRRAYNPVQVALLREQAGEISAAELKATLDTYRHQDNREQLEEFYLQNAVTHQHNLSLTGGNTKHNYALTLNYQGSRPTTQKSQSELLGFTLKNSMKFTPWLTAYFTFAGNINNSQSQVGGDSFRAMFAVKPSYVMLKDEACNPIHVEKQKSEEELTRLQEIGLFDEHYSPIINRDKERMWSKNYYYRTQVGLKVALWDGLDLDLQLQNERSNNKSQTNYDKDSYTVRNMVNNAASYNPKTQQLVYNVPLGGQMREQRGDTNAYTFRPQLNYRLDNGVHSVAAILGGEIRAIKETATRNYYMGYDEYSLGYIPIDPLKLVSLKGVEDLSGYFRWDHIANNNVYEHEDRFVSVYSNASYTFANRLNLSGSIRIDQSNLFGTDPKYQYRPLWSLGASYDIAQEEFAKLPWLNMLKVRFTYGIGGNIPKDVGPYLILSAPQYNYWLHDFGSAIKSKPNRQLRWEKTNTTNVGVDFSLLDNRLTGSLDYYHKLSTDLLALRDADPTLGSDKLMLNYGAMENQGVELALQGTAIEQGIFSWNVGFIFNYNHNKMLNVEDSNREVLGYTQGNTVTMGYPYNSLFSFRFAGLDHETGLPRYYDKDGKIKAQITDLNDLVYSGVQIAPFFASLTNSFRAAGVELSLMLTYRGGHVVRDEAAPFRSYGPTTNISRKILNRWQKPGDEKDPEVGPALAGRYLDTNTELHPWYASDRHALRADCIRLQTANISYTLPRSITAKLGVESLRLSCQADNLLAIPLNKKGIDPEAISTTGYGWGNRVFLPSPAYNFGVALTF